MPKDNFSFETDKIITGVGKTTSIIRGAYGAAGGNTIVEEDLYPFFRVTNDGKLSVDQIKLADPIENIGANIIKEAGDRADKESRDGRKTTMILTEAILVESLKYKDAPMVIKKSLAECVPILLKSIDDQKKTITLDDVKAVATISAESSELGQLIQDIYNKVGKDGIIEVDNSNLPETFIEVTEGVRLRGAKSLGEFSNTEPGKAVYTNPKILISKDKITSVDQLEPIFIALKRNSINELVIYCDDMDMSVASRLAYTHLSGGFKTLIIKSPTLWKDWLFEDFAKITGATPINSSDGKTFKNFVLTDLGTCSKIIVNKEETRVIGIKDITEHIEYLRTLNTDDAKLRISWLQTKVGILKVGADTETDLAHKAGKAKDACAAAYLALKDGVVKGAGVSLVYAVSTLPKTVGGLILEKALLDPYNQLCKNFGTFSLNVSEDIIDPAIVVKNAIKNSISIASTVLTNRNCGIITKPKQ